MRRTSYWIGTALLSLGAIVLLAAGGIFAYGLYEDFEYQSAVATQVALATVEPTPEPTPVPPTETPTPTPAPTLTPTPSPTGTWTPVPVTPTSTPTVTPTPTQTPFPDNPRPATRIRIASIKLDAPVFESAIKNGQWVVPRFAAGHLQGTAQPGGPGNAVFAGHVSSINAGNVFADIGKLKPGDEIVLVTEAGDLRYLVSGTSVVKNDDLSVIRDFGDSRVTLITCTGTWLPLQRDYTHRTIVVGQRSG